MEPIRVLHENVIMDQGGIENLLMNIYRNIDRNKIQFDFMVHRKEKGYFDDEIRSLGGKIYITPPFNPFHHVAYMQGIKDVLKDHPEYRIIHCHSELNMWPLKIAAKLKIPTRIAHSHNSKTSINLKYFFMKYQQLFIKKYCTDMFMCSEKAGEWAFGKKVLGHDNTYIIKNGIDLNKFIFNDDVRQRVRSDYGIENKFVIGHVGRFMEQKNHIFLIDIFCEVLKSNPDTVLMLVGEGELKDRIKDRVLKYGIEESVIFTGVQNNVNELMMAMDVFVFPSLWEGLGIVAIEAQAAGLPCVFAETIPQEAYIEKSIITRKLSDPLEKWVNSILTFKDFERKDTTDNIKSAGFDIKTAANELQIFYLECAKRG